MPYFIQRLLALFSRPKDEVPAAPPVLRFDVARLKVQPGDSVVVSCKEVLNRQQADAILEMVRVAMPDKVRVLVLCGGLTMQVVIGSDESC